MAGDSAESTAGDLALTSISASAIDGQDAVRDVSHGRQRHRRQSGSTV